MADAPQSSAWLTRIAVLAFGGVTALLLLPGYMDRWTTDPPQDAQFYVRQAFEDRLRVYDEEGRFGRIPGDAAFGRVTSFFCEGSSEARREFGWRGAKELIFDCPAQFEGSDGRGYVWVFRLIKQDPASDVSPEGYGRMHTPEEEAYQILQQNDLYP